MQETGDDLFCEREGKRKERKTNKKEEIKRQNSLINHSEEMVIRTHCDPMLIRLLSRCILVVVLAPVVNVGLQQEGI